MGQSDVIILAVSLLGFALIGYFLFSLTKQKGGRALNARDDNDGERDGNQHRPRGNLRRRRVGVANENNDNEDEEDEGDDNQQGENEPDLTGMTKKEIAKIEKRRAKAQQREAMEAEREERKEREEARMELLREREQERDEEFRLKEMERLRELAAEEQQRKDAYNHWKDPFPDHILTFPTDMAIATASSSTSSSTGATESRNKTAAEMAEVHERFIASVKEAKTISLDELCSQFKLPTFNVIEILKHLLKKGDLCGMFIGDDQQQFICVDPSTVQKIASTQGTLSTTDLLKIVQ